MTKPRCVIPRKTRTLARRCSQRQYLLTPSHEAVKQVYLYCLAIAAKRFELDIHAFCVMSNHYHMIFTEKHLEAQYPKFTEWFHSQIAKALNAYHGRRENFWSNQRYHCEVLEDKEAVERALTYIVGNPVAAGLVRTPEEWPGLIVDTSQIGQQTFEIEKPDFYFKSERWPDKITLKVTKAPQFQDLEDQEYSEAMQTKVEEYVLEIHQRREEEGKTEYLGTEAILDQEPTDAPKAETRTSPVLRRRNSEELRTFWNAYQQALRAWNEARRDTAKDPAQIEFPHGTYFMRVRYGVTCLPPQS